MIPLVDPIEGNCELRITDFWFFQFVIVLNCIGFTKGIVWQGSACRNCAVELNFRRTYARHPLKELRRQFFKIAEALSHGKNLTSSKRIKLA